MYVGDVIEGKSICAYMFILKICYVIEGNSICAYMFILTICYVIEGTQYVRICLD